MLREKKTDILIEDYGTIAMLFTASRRGRTWVKKHVSYESWQVHGGGIACEPRMLVNVIQGARDHGLKVEVRP